MRYFVIVVETASFTSKVAGSLWKTASIAMFAREEGFIL